MSTRCCVNIKQAFRKTKGSDTVVKSVMLYHHHDGYPEGVGYDLKQRLEKHKGRWDIDEIANELIKDTGDEYEYTAYNHTDIEYMYVIDCSARTLKCFYGNLITYEDNNIFRGDEVPIP